MSVASNTLSWFASHESRLIWRDFIGMMTGGKPKRTATLAIVVGLVIAGLHAFAAYLIKPAVDSGIVADKSTLLFVSGGLVMFFSLMFSQAIESVTRAYYTRADLDLILSSPAHSHQLFEVRTSVVTLQTISLSLLIASPVINVLIVLDGWHWLGAYLAFMALGGLATASAVWVTLGLFRLVGTARTRLIAQIIAAIVGAGFIIALQGVAIIFGQGITRFSLFQSAEALSSAPNPASLLWLPARATMGDVLPLAGLVLLCGTILLATIRWSARRFGQDVLAVSGLSEARKHETTFSGFRPMVSLRTLLCRKEWLLLKRDPWLMSQSLQQVLYLIPPALLLWVNFGQDSGVLFVIVPVIVMAVGQLAGALAWLTISGEDAHELIATAPVGPKSILMAKVSAVLVIIGLLMLPFALAIGIASINAALWMLLGGTLASASAIVIQLMFRSQANRSLFRRRQVSSRAATLCEAMVSISWAGASALAVMGTFLAILPVVLVFITLGIAWLIRP